MDPTKSKKVKKKLRSPEKRDILIPEVEMMFNNILTSAHDVHSERIIMDKSEMSRDQIVVAAGPTAVIKVGDWVHINFTMFPKEPLQAPKHDIGPQKYAIVAPVYKIEGTEYLSISDRHIMWKIKK